MGGGSWGGSWLGAEDRPKGPKHNQTGTSGRKVEHIYIYILYMCCIKMKHIIMLIEYFDDIDILMLCEEEKSIEISNFLRRIVKSILTLIHWLAFVKVSAGQI